MKIYYIYVYMHDYATVAIYYDIIRNNVRVYSARVYKINIRRKQVVCEWNYLFRYFCSDMSSHHILSHCYHIVNNFKPLLFIVSTYFVFVNTFDFLSL